MFEIHPYLSIFYLNKYKGRIEIRSRFMGSLVSIPNVRIDWNKNMKGQTREEVAKRDAEMAWSLRVGWLTTLSAASSMFFWSA